MATSKLRLGTVTPAALKLGSTAVAKAYLGSTLVWDPAGTPWLTSFTPGPTRRNYPDFVGLKFTVGAANLTVTALGRWVIAGNTQTHVVKLVVAATKVDVPGGAVTVATAGQPGGAFTYVELPAPLTLTAGAAYYLASKENDAGDYWYDSPGTTVTGTAVATANDSAFYYAAAWSESGVGPGAAYVPPNFLYTVA